MTDLHSPAIQPDLDQVWSVPLSFSAFDAATVAELVDLYLEDATESIRRLRTAYGGGDIRTVGQLAHTLKGSSRNFHVASVADTTETIEDLSRKGLLEPVGPLLDRLEVELPKVAVSMRKVAGQ